jgi:hypothetical protein
MFFQAPTEVAQTFHYNPPQADTLRRSAHEVFPFQFCPTSSATQKNKRRKGRLTFLLPTHKKLGYFHISLNF